MNWLCVNRNPSRRQLLLFACSWLAMFAVAGWLTGRLGAMLWLPLAFWFVGLAVPLVSLFCPRVLRFFYSAVAFLVWPVAVAGSLVLLGIVYFTVIVPTGVLLRWFGYDPMRRRDSNDASYWIARADRSDLKRYFRQY